MALSRIFFHCPHCGVPRSPRHSFSGLTITCLNCRSCRRTFALLVLPLEGEPIVKAFKLDSAIMRSPSFLGRLDHLFQNIGYRLHQQGDLSLAPRSRLVREIERSIRGLARSAEELHRLAGDGAVLVNGDHRQKSVRNYRFNDFGGGGPTQPIAVYHNGQGPISRREASDLIIALQTEIPTAPKEADEEIR